jgi:hypothetical protein
LKNWPRFASNRADLVERAAPARVAIRWHIGAIRNQ